MNNNLKEKLGHIRRVICTKIGRIKPQKCRDYLYLSNICSILGIEMPKGSDESFTMINFARDSRRDGIAVVTEITSDPSYVTPDKRCAELADIAVGKGAKLLIAKKQYRDYPTLIVEDPFEAYCRIVSALRREFSPKTVSVTGSIGKTTATEMVYAMISSKYNTHRSPGTANNVLSVGNVVQGLKRSHQFYVQELMEGPPYGAASTISKIVQPQAAIVTRIGTSHMESFGSQHRILESCLGIQDGMPKDGLLILNADDPFQWEGRALCSLRVVYYGIDCEDADYRAVDIHSEGDWLCFHVKYGDKLVPIRIRCFGRHNVLNALASFAVGKWAGMSDTEIRTGLEKFRTRGIRQNYIMRGGYHLYLDCYNAAPESVEVALNTFSEIQAPKGGRHIAVLADVAEVGDKAEEYHRKIGRLAGASCLDLLICYGKDARFIAEEAKNYSRFPVYYTESLDELLRFIKENINLIDVTLFKGSHSMELDHVVDMTWGTWYHEEFEVYEFKTHIVSDRDLSYRVYTDHVTVTKKISTVEDLVIPDEIKGLPVTGIEQNTFSKNKQMHSVRLPSGLKNIRYCAFYGVNRMTEIDIPSSVRIIDASAFSTCKNLRCVNIAEGCTHLGYRSFYNCNNLEKIALPSTVRQIDGEAFLNCTNLTIYAPTDSFAAKYAKNHGIKCVEN